MSEETNIIKSTCKLLGITYGELGEQIGYGLDAVRKAAASGKISEPMTKSIELYIENIKLQKQIAESAEIKNTLKKWLTD